MDLGSGELVSVREVVERIRDLINPDLGLLFGGPGVRKNEQVRVANIAETRLRTNWSPSIPLVAGLSSTISSLKPSVRSS